GILRLKGAPSKELLHTLQVRVQGYGYDCHQISEATEWPPRLLENTWWVADETVAIPAEVSAQVHTYVHRTDFPAEGNVLAILEMLAQKKF
ncbi:MAG: hypothetical protein KDD51_05740, partial [Bdellovibrionales bacterium]|nr:hypothetical protein [Bdellovibrionales bacterium]